MTTLSPDQWKKLKAFRDLIRDTKLRVETASGQGALAQATSEAAPKWDPIDAEFATLLRDVAQMAWQLPFHQVRPAVDAIVTHLKKELADVDEQLR